MLLVLRLLLERGALHAEEARNLLKLVQSMLSAGMSPNTQGAQKGTSADYIPYGVGTAGAQVDELWEAACGAPSGRQRAAQLVADQVQAAQLRHRARLRPVVGQGPRDIVLPQVPASMSRHLCMYEPPEPFVSLDQWSLLPYVLLFEGDRVRVIPSNQHGFVGAGQRSERRVVAGQDQEGGHVWDNPHGIKEIIVEGEHLLLKGNKCRTWGRVCSISADRAYVDVLYSLVQRSTASINCHGCHTAASCS